MKITYAIEGLIKGKQQRSTIASGLGSAAAADRTAAEAVSQRATCISIMPVETEEKGEAERIEMEIAEIRMRKAMKAMNDPELSGFPGSNREQTILREIAELKAAYFKAVEDYKAAKAG